MSWLSILFSLGFFFSLALFLYFIYLFIFTPVVLISAALSGLWGVLFLFIYLQEPTHPRLIDWSVNQGEESGWKNQPNLHWRILAKHLAVVAPFLLLLFSSSSPHITIPAHHLHLLPPRERPVPLISCLPREAEGTLGPISPTGYPHTVKLSGGHPASQPPYKPKTMLILKEVH